KEAWNHILQCRGTGIPEKEDMQTHAILSYSMNTAPSSPFLENYQFSTLRRSANVMLYINGRVR
ncbi:MAG: hypothetical protein LBC19_11780, partial [Tannerella sp.]|nr:hypothetical protein [Tannerella sp.]